MQKERKIDLLLLARYFSGSISREECAGVEEWMSQSNENRVLAKQIQYMFHTSDALAALNKTNARAALTRVKTRIRKKKRIAALKRAALPVNAIILILMLVSILWNPAPLPREEAVRYIDMYSNPGLISSTELPDGSKVWLNSGSSIKYPVSFHNDVREVYLDGEAYFHVAKNTGKRFLVHMHDLSVEALGTEFNVDAYETNHAITTTLLEGSVCVYYKNDKEAKNRFMMAPGDQTVYDMETKKITRQETYLPKDIAWKDGRVLFRNTSFDEALWILSKRFNVDFTVKKKALYDASFTGSFTDQSLIRILEYFKISSGIQYTQKQTVTEDGEIQKTEVELY